MALSKCSRNFHRMKIYERATLAAGVNDLYYKAGSPFTAPVISQTDFETLMADYNHRYADFFNGGRAQKGAWLIAQTALVEALDLIADDVDEVAQGNPDVIIEGGFKPVKTHRSQAQVLLPPKIQSLDRGATGVIKASCYSLGTKVSYGCIISEGAPLPDNVYMQSGIIKFSAGMPVNVLINETNSRKKTFFGLTPGVTYYVYFFARNAAGVSALSEPQSILCG